MANKKAEKQGFYGRQVVEKEPNYNRKYPSMIGLEEQREDDEAEAAKLRKDFSGHYPLMNENGTPREDPAKIKQSKEIDRENKLELEEKFGKEAADRYVEYRKASIPVQASLEKTLDEFEGQEQKQKPDKSVADHLRETWAEREAEASEEEEEGDDDGNPW